MNLPPSEETVNTTDAVGNSRLPPLTPNTISPSAPQAPAIRQSPHHIAAHGAGGCANASPLRRPDRQSAHPGLGKPDSQRAQCARRADAYGAGAAFEYRRAGHLRLGAVHALRPGSGHGCLLRAPAADASSNSRRPRSSPRPSRKPAVIRAAPRAKSAGRPSRRRPLAKHPSPAIRRPRPLRLPANPVHQLRASSPFLRRRTIRRKAPQPQVSATKSSSSAICRRCAGPGSASSVKTVSSAPATWLSSSCRLSRAAIAAGSAAAPCSTTAPAIPASANWPPSSRPLRHPRRSAITPVSPWSPGPSFLTPARPREAR